MTQILPKGYGRIDGITPGGVPYTVYSSMPDHIYHSLTEWWGSSVLRSNYANSKKYKYDTLDGNFKVTEAMKFGTDTHSCLLESAVFKETYSIIDESKRPVLDKSFTVKKNKEWKADEISMCEELGKRPLMSSDYEDIQGMKQSMYAWRKGGIYPIKQWLENNTPEMSFFLQDFHGIPVKIRIDILIEKIMWAGDLKTTKDCSHKGFKYAIIDRGYDMQTAFYNDVYEEITGKSLKQFFILAVERKAPYNFNPIDMTEWFDDDRFGNAGGRTKYLNAIKKASQLLPEYNGYVDNIQGNGLFNKIRI